MKKTEEIRAKVDKIFNNFNDWGYKYRVSDYAGSKEQEYIFIKDGQENINKMRDEIVLLLTHALAEREKQIAKKLETIDKEVTNDDEYYQGVQEIISHLKEES